MSRWHVLEYDRPNQEVLLAHACPGAHTPYTEHVTAFLLANIPELGEKPMFECRMCAAFGRSDPHLPGPRDVATDLGLGRAEEWLKLVYQNWREGRGTE